MQFTFFKFFLTYIFKAKTRQGLLILALTGLVLSSLSLVVVQATLQGLQNNRISKAKSLTGHFRIPIDGENVEVEKFLEQRNIPYAKELLIEGLLRKGGRIAPIILHGHDAKGFIPDFLGTYIAYDDIQLSDISARKLKVSHGEQISFFSPAIVDSFFGDVPRQKILNFENFFYSSEPEIDEFHAWTSLEVLQSLKRSKEYNNIRIYDALTSGDLDNLEAIGAKLITWEKENNSLVYALRLENSIMIFLFLATVVLVIISIAGGLTIFYNRLKSDFASFWILGLSLNNIRSLGLRSLSLITILTVAFGNLMGVLTVFLLKHYSPTIMPDMFVERSLPVQLAPEIFIYSFIIPGIITLVITLISNNNYFSKKADFLNLIRSAGR